jgi:hypothetical protein
MTIATNQGWTVPFPVTINFFNVGHSLSLKFYLVRTIEGASALMGSGCTRLNCVVSMFYSTCATDQLDDSDTRMS